jgi:hypothetical protein
MDGDLDTQLECSGGGVPVRSRTAGTESILIKFQMWNLTNLEQFSCLARKFEGRATLQGC